MYLQTKKDVLQYKKKYFDLLETTWAEGSILTKKRSWLRSQGVICCLFVWHNFLSKLARMFGLILQAKVRQPEPCSGLSHKSASNVLLNEIILCFYRCWKRTSLGNIFLKTHEFMVIVKPDFPMRFGSSVFKWYKMKFRDVSIHSIASEGFRRLENCLGGNFTMMFHYHEDYTLSIPLWFRTMYSNSDTETVKYCSCEPTSHKQSLCWQYNMMHTLCF